MPITKFEMLMGNLALCPNQVSFRWLRCEAATLLYSNVVPRCNYWKQVVFLGFLDAVQSTANVPSVWWFKMMCTGQS